ncbi:hypothetical protein Kuja_0400 [Vibrio phage vB_VchM_Kuja]|uniref:Uncharacterized protein n=1 Tax=Vibrio phage vB_VchM_Kuja TaxID=2686437 RepID=A0A6B9J5A5_9CAUD|nr:hypothetical protein HWC83_gp040 [Vibrio phage vB_VchM_Kuja]QGZ16031.1 hypothetical protein Kuja_0400 [Vibrio phage vB_VchM_Kuja]
MSIQSHADKEYDKPIDINTFSDAVLLSQKVGKYRGQPLSQIILGLCDDYKIEVDKVPDLLSVRVKRALEVEAINNKMVKGKVNKNRLF